MKLLLSTRPPACPPACARALHARWLVGLSSSLLSLRSFVRSFVHSFVVALLRCCVVASLRKIPNEPTCPVLGLYAVCVPSGPVRGSGRWAGSRSRTHSLTHSHTHTRTHALTFFRARHVGGRRVVAAAALRCVALRFALLRLFGCSVVRLFVAPFVAPFVAQFVARLFVGLARLGSRARLVLC